VGCGQVTDLTRDGVVFGLPLVFAVFQREHDVDEPVSRISESCDMAHLCGFGRGHGVFATDGRSDRRHLKSVRASSIP
jgi:hypothetical protein